MCNYSWVFGILREHNVDTKGMSLDDAFKRLNKLRAQEKREYIENKATKRIKVARFTNPLYKTLTLSNGRNLGDMLSKDIEVPETGTVGIEHIESHEERKGMFELYKNDIYDIVNDPDYVFESKKEDKPNTILIAKKLNKNLILVIALSYSNPRHTNTLVTMREESDKSFEQTIKGYTKAKKVLYKKS